MPLWKFLPSLLQPQDERDIFGEVSDDEPEKAIRWDIATHVGVEHSERSSRCYSFRCLKKVGMLQEKLDMMI